MERIADQPKNRLLKCYQVVVNDYFNEQNFSVEIGVEIRVEIRIEIRVEIYDTVVTPNKGTPNKGIFPYLTQNR